MKKVDKWNNMDKNVVLLKKFFKVRSETDKIMLKLQEWDDFKKNPKKTWQRLMTKAGRCGVKLLK